MNLKFIKIALVFAIALTLFFSCSTPNSVTRTESELTIIADSSDLYMLPIRFFILFPTDTANLYGSVQCTVTINGEIISATDDTLLYRTITLYDTTISDGDSIYRVYPQKFQLAHDTASLEASSITRFFEVNDRGTEVHQRAYIDGQGIYYPSKENQLVIKDSLRAGSIDANGNYYEPDRWKATPIIPNMVDYSTGYISCEGECIAHSAIAPTSTDEAYYINNIGYSFGILLVTHYTIFGEAIINGSSVKVGGVATLKRRYFKDYGLIEQEFESIIQKTHLDGKVEVEKKVVYFARGPEGAKSYNETELPPIRP